MSSTTVYPYITAITNALQTGLSLQWPIQCYANLESVTIQGTPQVSLVMEETVVRDVIGRGRTISTLRMDQTLTILMILRNASDQSVTNTLLLDLGEWQANILHLLCRDVLMSGGPLKVIDLPKPEAIAGGAIAGRIRLGLQFAFEAE